MKGWLACTHLIEKHRTEICALAKRHGIDDLRIFGSMARGNAGDDSDVDLLVSLPPGKSGLVLGGLLMDVQDLLQPPGRSGDRARPPSCASRARAERGTAFVKPGTE